MHSSRMRTARSSSHQEGSASVHTGIHPLGVGLETPLAIGLETPQVWAWRPPGYGSGDPHGCGPGDPPSVGLETPLPGQIPQLLPPGVGLETCKACWDTTPGDLLQGILGYHL